jgi:hypothetical protein
MEAHPWRSFAGATIFLALVCAGVTAAFVGALSGISWDGSSGDSDAGAWLVVGIVLVAAAPFALAWVSGHRHWIIAALAAFPAAALGGSFGAVFTTISPDRGGAAGAVLAMGAAGAVALRPATRIGPTLLWRAALLVPTAALVELLDRADATLPELLVTFQPLFLFCIIDVARRHGRGRAALAILGVALALGLVPAALAAQRHVRDEDRLRTGTDAWYSISLLDQVTPSHLTTYALGCRPGGLAGGDHPHARAACAEARRFDFEAASCPPSYDNVYDVEVRGHAPGAPTIYHVFRRGNACERREWDRMRDFLVEPISQRRRR